MRVKKDWYKKFFKDSFYNPASPAAVEHAPEEAAFVMRVLGLKKRAKILDLCCGPGRHSVLLAEKGFDVTGFDFSKEYLAQAEQKAERAGARIKFIHGDMRRLKFKNEFDAAINMFTSFGYFRNFKDDIRVLKGINKSLKHKGLLLMDIKNGESLRWNFSPRDWYEENGAFYLEERAFKPGTKNMLQCRRVKIAPGGKMQGRFFEIRVYNKKSLSIALSKAGFIPLKFWGGFDGQKLSDKTKRLIVLAKKQ